jgi:hypothetical protein
MDDLVLMASQWMGSSCGSEAGLVAHWKLNEVTGNAADSSGSGYTDIVAGGSWNPAGGLNYCGALGRRHRLELSMVSPEFREFRVFANEVQCHR